MQFTEVAAGRTKQSGGPQAGTPDLQKSNFGEIQLHIYWQSFGKTKSLNTNCS